MRTGHALLALAAFAGSVAAQMPPDTKFALQVANEINAVAAFTPPDFTLSVREEQAQLAFYGREPNRLDGVRCERQAAFEFVALANLTGHMQVAICASEAKRVRTLAVMAPRSLEALLVQLPEIDMERRRKLGWTTTRAQGPNGTEEHAFPVVAIGHGMLVAQTAVIVTAGGRQAVVVQADTYKLCESYGLKDKTALCRDTRQALMDIARRLEKRFARQ
ncbi:MAG TPA: hypothetical protein VL982_09575 [Burkholderiales bacterium]|nr:hypothetical protein [Burkholderiales bacterium]